MMLQIDTMCNPSINSQKASLLNRDPRKKQKIVNSAYKIKFISVTKML